MVEALRQFLKVDAAPIENFCSAHPKIAVQTEKLLYFEWILVSLVTLSHASFSGFTPFCLHQIHDYHRESALLCMRGQANVGLSLTRMACELSRDVLRFARDNETEKIWLSRRDDNKTYKKIFKFNMDIPEERMLFDIYELASAFGVHGHFFFMEREAFSKLSYRGEEFMLHHPDQDPMKIFLSLNLTAIICFVMAFLCEHGKAFVDSGDPDTVSDAKLLAHHVFIFMQSFEIIDTAGLAESHSGSRPR
jgi:hypothetical protein